VSVTVPPMEVRYDQLSVTCVFDEIRIVDSQIVTKVAVQGDLDLLSIRNLLGPVYKVATRRHLRIAAMCSASRNELASLS